MRIYSRFPEAMNEIRRDCAEMGIRVHPHSWQDKIVKDDPDFDTLELQNYVYCVTSPDLKDLKPIQPWADAEFAERVEGINGNPVNPGEAWKLREEVWKNFLVEKKDQFEELERPKFGYSYAERLSAFSQVARIIYRLKSDPDSRQLWISIWEPEDVMNLGGVSRVPCTLGYQIQVRQGQLNLTYIQRSADLITHFENDVWMAHSLQRYIAERVNIPVGLYTHMIFSLHMFRKDAKDVF